MSRAARLGGLLVSGLVLAAAPARAGEPLAVAYEGTAREADRFAYRESHFVARAADGSGERVVLYRCEDGRPFARKLVRYRGESPAPDFRLDDARTGFSEGVRTRGDRREVFVRNGHAKRERVARLPASAGLVADAGFDDFVLRNWDALLAGRAMRLPFVVPGELEAIVFKVRHARGTEIEGRAAEVFTLALDAWYGRFLPKIDVGYDADERVLLRYEGLSNIRDLALDNVVVRIDFPRAARAPLDPAALERARAEPLAQRCG